jgi:hypothetical protein
MDDSTERYYSPPPPTGLRERLRARRRSVIAAAVAVLVVGGVFGIARVVSGDGKGSGNIERAFGGYVSPEDQDTLASVTIARKAAQTSYVDMAAAARKHDVKGLIRAADKGRSEVDQALSDTSGFENDQLQAALTAMLKPLREVFVAYGRLAAYASSHRGTGSRAKFNELVRRAADAEASARTASEAFYQRISVYMTPGQRRQLREEERAWQAELHEAGR